jgi:hypothetical protein
MIPAVAVMAFMVIVAVLMLRSPTRISLDNPEGGDD